MDLKRKFINSLSEQTVHISGLFIILCQLYSEHNMKYFYVFFYFIMYELRKAHIVKEQRAIFKVILKILNG